MCSYIFRRCLPEEGDAALRGKDIDQTWFEDLTAGRSLEVWAAAASTICGCLNNPQNGKGPTLFGPLRYPIIPLNRDVIDKFPANLARLKVWVRPPKNFHSSNYGTIFEYRRGVGAFYHVPKSLA